MRVHRPSGAGRLAAALGAALVLALASVAGAAGPRKLAVLELSDTAGLDTAVVAFLGERVRGEASGLPREAWLVITRENLLLMLPPGTDLADCQGECEVETGRNIGADVVLSGAVVRLGDELRVTLRAHETRSGGLLGQEVAAAPGVAGLDEAVAAAARRLVQRLGEPEGPRGRGVLRLRAPAGLDVQINGVRVGRTPVPEQPLDAGAHRVDLESRCHAPLRVPVDLAPDEVRTLDLAPPARLARLRVEALTPEGEGVGAQVFVDGRRLGETPGDFTVPVCAERIEVRGAGGRWRQALSLREDAVTGLTATLGERRAARPEAAPAARDDGGWSTATWLMVGGAAAVALGGGMALKNRADGGALRKDPGNPKLREEVDASHQASLGLYLGGGIAAASGLLWWLLTPGDAPAGLGAGAPGGVTWEGTW